MSESIAHPESLTPNEQTLLATTSAELDVMSRAVDIEIGQDIYGVALAEIQNVRQNHLEKLPIGLKTRETFDGLMNSLISKEDGMMIFGGEYGEYDPRTNKILLSPGIVDWQRNLIASCFEDANIDIDEQTLTKLTIRYLTLHELGHTLQHAHRIVAYQTGREEESELSLLAFKSGVIAPHPALPEDANKIILEHHANNVDKERFAEGFAQLVLMEDLPEQLSLNQETSEKLASLMRNMRAYQVAPIADIIRENGSDFGMIFQAIGKDNRLNLLQLGYGSPHPPEDIIKEMKLTY